MITSPKIVLFFFILSCLSLQAKTVELDTARTNAPILNEVVITSSKDNRLLRNLPNSITILTSNELSNQNITSIKDISAVIPNLFFPDYGSKLTSPVYIRGIGSKINAPSVGLYVDGVPYFEKSVFDFEFDEVERIEVLRGPQGTLYGRNTMGGVINVTTKNPLEHQGGKISLTRGNYGHKEASASYFGRILSNLGYSFSGKYNHNDGYFINRYTGEEADKLDAVSGTGKLFWKASSSLNFKLHVRYDNLNQNGYPYALIDSSKRIGDVNYDSVSSYQRELYSSALVINKSFPQFVIRSVTGFQNMADLQAIDQDFSVKPTMFVTQKQNQTLWSEELEAHSTSTGAYQWLLGAFLFNQTSQIHLKANTTLKDYDAPSKGLAFYHQSTINHFLINGLAITAGIRYDREIGSQAYFYQAPDKKKPGEMEIKADLHTPLSSSQWSPKLSLQYKLNRFNQLYASATKGYKTGGFNTSFDTITDQTFKPEYSWNYELGYKYGLLSNRISGEMAVFYTDWKNQQISQPLVKSMGSQLRNAGHSYSKGAEFSMQAQLLKGWNANMSYGFTEAKFLDYQSGTTSFSNNYIPYVPNHTLMVGTDYTLTINKPYWEKVIVSCQYVETGKLFWNDKNSAYQSTFGQFNEKVSLVSKNLKLDLWVKNSTATDYTAFYFELSNKPYGQKGKPRTLGATLTVFIP